MRCRSSRYTRVGKISLVGCGGMVEAMFME